MRPACQQRMARPSTDYEPRAPAQGALYQIVRDHFETFRAQAATIRDGEGLPGFVERAFRTFLRCGWLAGGFARLRCRDCGLDRLIPFSCKGRALCPSCGGRRMAERAAHLVDQVFPDVPIRQWVLSLPYRLRYQLAWDHDLWRAVVGVLFGAVFRVLRARVGDDGVEAGRGGGVAVIQRFGGALNLNVHIHALVMDGVFARDHAGALCFHPAPHLTTLDVAEVLATVEPLIMRRLERRGLGPGDGEAGAPDAWTDEAPVLAGLAAASVQGTIALGPRRGARLRRLGDAAEPVETSAPGHCHARANGFDLHAGLVVPAGQRERLERIVRYTLRPPVPQERLHLTGDGQVRLELRHPWRDGTTDIVFDPVEFLGRLAVLVPRPRINLLLYHGVLGPRAAWRAEVVQGQTPVGSGDTGLESSPVPAREPDLAETARRQACGQCWSSLMARTFGFDVLACPRRAPREAASRGTRVWRPPASDRAHRGGGRHRPDPSASRSADRGAGTPPRAGATAVREHSRSGGLGRRQFSVRPRFLTGS
ncbi:MAG: hypothetical protein A3G21_02535 [Acidobacteria bacterium RIFCSPLOWO2_12_FULL_66_21]|nr:MAG: hypothetical protein A3G21_02535 [Acidobacteria bacterium RIFCSPLOWO2_12_FULL_66_21]